MNNKLIKKILNKIKVKLMNFSRRKKKYKDRENKWQLQNLNNIMNMRKNLTMKIIIIHLNNRTAVRIRVLNQMNKIPQRVHSKIYRIK
jgi:hypothetical protein